MNMTRIARRFATVALGSAVALLASGCSIKEHVQPVSSQYIAHGEICIIDAPRVRPGFLVELKSVLRQRGYKIKMLADDSSLLDCPTVVTYTGRWGWDFTLYMTYAEIRVFSSGKMVGEAVYDSRRGGGRPDKWIDAEPKIRELVEQLFPVREASATQ